MAEKTNEFKLQIEMTEKDLEALLFEIKKRLEHDENKWLKIQMQSNQQHSHTLNQLADAFTIIRQLQAQVKKLERNA